MPWVIPPWLALVEFLGLTVKEHDKHNDNERRYVNDDGDSNDNNADDKDVGNGDNDDGEVEHNGGDNNGSNDSDDDDNVNVDVIEDDINDGKTTM
jgi:hypothetical protein